MKTCIQKIGIAAVMLLATVAQGSAQQRAQTPVAPQRQAQQAQQAQQQVQPAKRRPIYQRRDTWYDFLLKQFNPDNLDYGTWLEQRRQAFLDARVRNRYFGYSLFATLGLGLMAAVCVKLRIDHRRAMWVTAEMMADVYNHDVYSREVAKDAIERYNQHIELCNRAIEAGESGHTSLSAGDANEDALRAELQRMGGELVATKRERDRVQEELQKKDAILTDMSLRLEGLGKKGGGNDNGGQPLDLRGANPDLVKHINGLQEQLYAERQKNRQLKGA